MENTKDMKKDVLITIKGTQKIGNEKDVIEMVTTGRFYRKNQMYYISYEETEATGYEGCRTTLKVGQRQGDNDPLWNLPLPADCGKRHPPPVSV